MIQRIQSIWLLLAAAASFLSFKFSFYSGNIVSPDRTKAFVSLTALDRVPLMLLTGLVGLASIIILFLYKNRKLQMKLILVNLFLSIGMIALFFKYTADFVEGNLNPLFVVPLLVPIFLLLAARGVYKDDKLIKSLDRLR